MTAKAPPNLTGDDPPALGLQHPKMHETQILTSIAAIEAVQDEWETFLRARAGDHNLMQQPDIIKYDLRENSDIYEPMIVILRQGGQIEAVAPWFVHRLRFPMKLGVIKLARVPLRLFKLAGAGMALDRKAHATDTLDRIFSAVYELRKKFDLIALFDITVPGYLWDYLESVKTTSRHFRNVPAARKPLDHHRIVLPDTFDDYMATLTSKRRNSLRRQERDLQKATANSVTTACTTSPEKMVAFFDDVRQVYQASWQGRTMGGEFGTGAQVRFYQRVAAHGWFRSYLVQSAAGPICYGMGYQYDGVYYCQDMAYDTAWRRCAPGNYMFVNLIRDLYRHNTPQIVDFGSGDSVFKHEFSNDVGSVQTVYVVPSRSYYGLAVVRAQRLMEWVYKGVYAALTRMGADRWVRERIKRRHRAN